MHVEDVAYISPGQAKRHPGNEDCPVGMRPIRGSLTKDKLPLIGHFPLGALTIPEVLPSD
jgi:hypothetical protein